jgi:hypothetical protein
MIGSAIDKIFSWFQVSGFSPAAGLKSGQFNRKRNFVVSYEGCGARI